MKKLLQTFLASVALLFIGTGLALAQDIDFSRMKVTAIGERLTSVPTDASQWYMLSNKRGTMETPAYDAGVGNGMYRASDNTDVAVGAMANPNFLIRFVPVEGYTSSLEGSIVVYMQWATGNYWEDISSYGNSINITTVSDQSEAGIYNMYFVNGNGVDGFAFNAFDLGTRVDNNGVGSTVVTWDNGAANSSNDNCIWYVYPVTLTEASDAEIENDQNMSALEALVEKAESTIDYYYGGFDLSIETGFSSGNGIGNGLITSASQFSSPYSDSAEGTSFEPLLDNNTGTFWHTDWHSSAPGHGVHYLQVDLADDFAGGALMLDFLRRASNNDHVCLMSVKDVNDNVLVESLELPFTSSGERVKAGFICPEGITTLRFYEEQTINYNYNLSDNGYWHCSNFQLFATTYTEDLNTGNPDALAAMEAAIATAQAVLESGIATAADIEALQTAIDTYTATLLGTGTETGGDSTGDYAIGDEVTINNRTYTILSENMVENHSFELGFTGWTNASDFTTEITSDKFKLVNGGAQEGDTYLVGTVNEGASGTGSLGKVWKIEDGKSYYFSYYIKGETEDATNASYMKTSLTNTIGDEEKMLEEGTKNITTEWKQINVPFTNSEGYEYLQIKFRWLDSQWGFDNIQLYEVDPSEVELLVEPGDYLVVNAETGYYLGGGLTWGTQGTLLKEPQFFTFETIDDGVTYSLDSHQYNNASSHYLGSNLYVDSSNDIYWTIADAGDGNYTLYNEAAGGYLSGDYSSSQGWLMPIMVLEEPAEASLWKLVTKAEIIASMDEATADNPVDVTALIAFPELKRNCVTSYSDTVPWAIEGYGTTEKPSNYSFGSGSNTANCAESYHSTNGFNIHQTLTDLKAGMYVLSAQAFYRLDDGGTGEILPVMYAGDVTATLPNMNSGGLAIAMGESMANAYLDFTLGCFPVSLTFVVENDGTDVEIGFTSQTDEQTYMWNIFGEMGLTYYGTNTVHECGAEFGDWTIAGNSGGAFQLNTWSTEDDPSGMVTPFIEYWVGAGSKLSDATISHTTLTGLADGYYDVTITARAFNEQSLTDVAEGTIFFNANEESIDITSGTVDVFGGVSAEVYGTYELLAYVTDGTLDINFTINGTNCDWLAFKNLSVDYLGVTLPTLAAIEGTMNVDVEAAMTAAVDAYNADKTADGYIATKATIRDAEASVAYYAPIVEAVEALDSDGAAVWAESDYASALENRTLTNEDLSADLAAAQKAQTTAGSDMTYVVTVTGTWGADQGNGPASYSSFATETYIGTGEATEGAVLYKTIEGLTAGTYTVSFYVAANMANGVSGDTGDGITEAFANGEVEAITVGSNSADDITSLEDMTLVTITCTVGSDGALTFGLQNVADGGNWFLGAACSLTLVKTASDLSALIAQYEADLDTAAEVIAELEEKIKDAAADEAYDADILEQMEDALAGLQEVVDIYGDIDTTDTTADELTEAIEALEAAIASAESALATAIDGVATAGETDAIYTVAGVRVSNMNKPGIYIVNGKKVLVK